MNYKSLLVITLICGNLFAKEPEWAKDNHFLAAIFAKIKTITTYNTVTFKTADEMKDVLFVTVNFTTQQEAWDNNIKNLNKNYATISHHYSKYFPKAEHKTPSQKELEEIQQLKTANIQIMQNLYDIFKVCVKKQFNKTIIDYIRMPDEKPYQG
jgi:hypothetical protein